jgi:hypothetical protein
MPSAKGQHNALLPGICFYLAHGRIADVNERPEIPHGLGSGTFEAFMLWGRVINLRLADVRPHARTVLDELQDLWQKHEREIRASVGVAEPWVAQFLRQHTSERSQTK